MKFKTEELKKLGSMYYLKNAMTKANCSPEDEAKIGNKILENDELLQLYTANLFELKEFYNFFSTNKADHKLEQKIYDKFLSSEQKNLRFFDNYFYFSGTFELLINKALTSEIKLKRCTDLLNLLSKSPTFNQIKMAKVFYLSDFIGIEPMMEEQILSWAKEVQLVKSDDEKNKIIIKKGANEKEQEKQKPGIETAPAEIMEKIRLRNRFNVFNTDLHRIASSEVPQSTDLQTAIALIKKDGAALEHRDQFGATPLINAAIAGKTELTLLLLSWGAKVAVIDQDGYKPKFFKLFYSCDHEYYENACIPLNKRRDDSMRMLLTKIEGLERSYLANEAGYYSLEQIKVDLLSIIQDKDFQNSKPLAALCGYVYNNVLVSDQKAVWQFFMEHCKGVDIRKESNLLASIDKNLNSERSLNSSPKSSSIDILVDYRKQLFRNEGNLNPRSMDTDDQFNLSL